jgi:hypothetical protein
MIEENSMHRLPLALIVLLLAGGVQAQEAEEIGTKNTVPVPSNGFFGGADHSVWTAKCKPGMVMTGIEIVVGGTCKHQCDADGRPLAAYRILCSELESRKAVP